MADGFALITLPGMGDKKQCQLQAAVGRTLECPEAACPFWEQDTSGDEAGCGFDRLGITFDDPNHARQFLDEWTLDLLLHGKRTEVGVGASGQAEVKTSLGRSKSV